MAASLIYRYTALYNAVMRLLYGSHYESRYQALADLIPEHSSVVDLCCGPGRLYTHYLRKKHVDYTGLDLNEGFVRQLTGKGIKAAVFDARGNDPLPRADYVLMQASLYHFLPDPSPIVDRMLAAASKAVIIAEPIRNLASSSNPVLAFAGRHLTDPGNGDQPSRFDETRLDQFFERYGSSIQTSFLIPGGREKAFVIRPSECP